MGRHTTFSQTAASIICQKISMGMALREIAGQTGCPKRAETICNWVNKHPDFAKQYERARELQQDWAADEVVRTGKRAIDGEIDANAARVYTDALKWRAGKLNKRYSDRVTVEHSIDDKLLNRLEAAETRMKLAMKDIPKPLPQADSDAIDV